MAAVLGSWGLAATKIAYLGKKGIMEADTKASKAVAQVRTIVQEKLALREIRRRVRIRLVRHNAWRKLQFARVTSKAAV